MFKITVSAVGYETITNVVMAETIRAARNEERNAVNAWLDHNAIDSDSRELAFVKTVRVCPKLFKPNQKI